MRKISCIITLLMLLSINGVEAQFLKGLWGKNKSDKTNNTELKEIVSSYNKLIKDFKTKDGLFKIHTKDDQLYFEIPLKLFRRDFLLSSRVSAISNNKDVVAGQIPREPMLIRFTKDNKKVYMHIINSREVCPANSCIKTALERNTLDPIMKSFEIKSFNEDSTNVVIDVSKFFCSDIKELSPFRKENIFDIMMRRSPLSGSLVCSNSKILKTQSFPLNVNIRSRLAYKTQQGYFVSELTRSIMLLPEKPMRPRFSDKRIGYFQERKVFHDENNDEVKYKGYINRWDLRPRREDIEKYKRGELVTPEKQIVWYVDTAIPAKWRKYIIKGIEDWKIAFEEIGFKDAIVAREYPSKEENPEFDPDDIRYSCYRYIPVTIANSMGPSWVDPRSGEILTGDVIFYSNVTKLLNEWRFVQTAQVDPRVRKETFSDDIMGASLRYVAAHEVGHTLGLMHNMAASHSYPVDSLRSAKFTSIYGTTASIMDYARYNYVAQPDDEGVNLCPPVLGVYDKYAIKWGYKPIFEAETPKDEYDILNRWVLEKSNDPRYYYGEQQFFLNMLDPKSVSEDLGDNSVKAGKYGIKNLKYIMKNLKNWSTVKNHDFSRMQSLHRQIFGQFRRYIGHASNYLGGFYLYNAVKGENKPNFVMVSKEEQREALEFIVDNIRELPSWFMNKEVVSCFKPDDIKIGEYIKLTIMDLMKSPITAHLIWNEKRYPNTDYNVMQYMEDVFHQVWKNAQRGRNLNYWERTIHYAYIKQLLSDAGYDKIVSRNNKNLSAEANVPDFQLQKMGIDLKSLVQFRKEADVKINMNSIYFYLLKKCKSRIRSCINSGDKITRAHYGNLYDYIDKFVK